MSNAQILDLDIAHHVARMQDIDFLMVEPMGMTADEAEHLAAEYEMHLMELIRLEQQQDD